MIQNQAKRSGPKADVFEVDVEDLIIGILITEKEIGLIVKKFIMKSIKFGIIMVVIVSLGVIIMNAIVVGSTQKQIVQVNDILSYDADCVLVLGAGVWEGNIPSPMLKDRLDKGIEISQAGIETTLLMSGDHGTVDYDEVNVMKDYAIQHGLISSDIFMDHAGFSTYDSLYRAKVIFGVKKLIIVSQKEHLYRALYIANALGLEAIGVAAEPQQYGGQFLRDVRETLARVKDAFTSLIKPKASVLGDTIPIDGNGDVTND